MGSSLPSSIFANLPITNNERESSVEAQRQSRAVGIGGIADARRYPRFKLEVDIKIDSRTCGLLKGYTVDISEGGVSAILKLEVPVSEVVVLDFTLPLGQVVIHATVRQKRAFRYGFQFVDSGSAPDAIRATCCQLAAEQSSHTNP